MRRHLDFRLFPLLAGVIGQLFLSCGQHRHTVALSKQLAAENIECIALFPFENLSDNPQAGTVVAHLLENMLLASGRLRILGVQDVEYLLKTSAVSSSLKKPGDLGRFVRAHGVISGRILEYGYKNDEKNRGVEPIVSVEVHLYDLPKGDIVWSSTIVRSSQGIAARNRDPLSRVTLLALEDVVDSLMASLPQLGDIDQLKRCGY